VKLRMMNRVTIRAYGPLNDFLRSAQRQVDVTVTFAGRTSVKDLLEGIGVPHPEIDLVLRNGESVAFDCIAHDGDRIAAFPRFHTMDIVPVTRVRSRPLASVRFVLDGHLGKLARRLRLVGLDAICPAGADDSALANLADREDRILLTRDRALLKRRVVTHGAFVRETDAHRQLVEVLQRFGPFEIVPFSRCLRCNSELREVPKSLVEILLPPRTRIEHHQFQRCSGCGRIYWQGSHWKRLARAIDAALGEAAALSTT
jgi:uncharacterized protein with PIN domain